jgi:hypothetical protein
MIPMCPAEAVGAHPTAVSATGSALFIPATISPDSAPHGCSCPTYCEAISPARGTRLGVNEFTVSAVAVADFALLSVDGGKPALWRTSTQGPLRQPIGLAIAALAVSRI